MDQEQSAVAEFALDGTAASAPDSDYVIYPNSKLFEAGDYPDRKFSLTPAELVLATAMFDEPVPVNLEHKPTPFLDGNLGEVRSVRPSDDGKTLYGTVAIPKWLDKIVGPTKKVSCEWDRDTKKLQRLSLTHTPRVEGAALFTAFAEATFAGAPAHKTWHGQSVIQTIHDHSATYGAVCDPSNSANFVSGRERTAIQKLHDLAVEHGAQCSIMSNKSAFSAVPTEEPTMASPREAFDALFSSDAKPSTEDIAYFAEKLATINSAEKAPEPEKPATFADSPEAKAMRAEIEKLKRDARLSVLKSDAAKFAHVLVNGDKEKNVGPKALPAEEKYLVAQYIQAAVDDEISGTASFSVKDENGEVANRLALLKASFEARPTHALYQERIADADLPDGHVVLFHKTKPVSEPQSDPKERERLLAMTELGRRVLADKKK